MVQVTRGSIVSPPLLCGQVEAAERLGEDIGWLIIHSLKACQNVMIQDRHCFECFGRRAASRPRAPVPPPRAPRQGACSAQQHAAARASVMPPPMSVRRAGTTS